MMSMKPVVYTFCALALLSTTVGCTQETERVQTAESAGGPALGIHAHTEAQAQAQAEAEAAAEEAPVPDFVAAMQPTSGSEVTGTVSFFQAGNSVDISVNVEGLTPVSSHGFHIHELGDCSAADGSSAGDHFNPDNQPHGAPDSAQRHAGDLGNLTSNGFGVAQTDLPGLQLSLSGDNSIVGRAVVIHMNADDLQSQPSGESGDPVACGVIEANNS